MYNDRRNACGQREEKVVWVTIPVGVCGGERLEGGGGFICVRHAKAGRINYVPAATTGC